MTADWEVRWKALELEVRRALSVLMVEEPDNEDDAISILLDAINSPQEIAMQKE